MVGVGEFWNDYGLFCYTLARYVSAEDSYLKALRSERASLGGNHPFLAVTHANLGNLFRQQGRYRDAERELDTAIDQGKKIWGNSHPRFGRFLISVARLNLAEGQADTALSIINTAIDVLEKNIGMEHSWLVPALITRAECQIEKGDMSGAESNLDRAAKILLKVFKTDNLLTAEIKRQKARIWSIEKKNDQAVQEFTDSIEIFTRAFGENHPEIAQTSHSESRPL